MSMYVFDTDMLSLYQHGHPVVLQNAVAQLSAGLAITVITIEEQLSGWYTLLRRAKTHLHLTGAYARLAENARSYAGWLILDFLEPALLRFERLRNLKLGVGGNDLRIAAIVQENAAILVTRNTSDFQRVPGLMIEDWTR